MVGRRKEFRGLEALKTADWRSQDFPHSFGNSTKIDPYVDEISHKEVSIPLIKNFRNKNIQFGKKIISNSFAS